MKWHIDEIQSKATKNALQTRKKSHLSRPEVTNHATNFMYNAVFFDKCTGISSWLVKKLLLLCNVNAQHRVHKILLLYASLYQFNSAQSQSSKFSCHIIHTSMPWFLKCSLSVEVIGNDNHCTCISHNPMRAKCPTVPILLFIVLTKVGEEQELRNFS